MFPPATLDTARVHLRIPTLDDAPDVFEYAARPEVSRHMLWRPHVDEDDTRVFLQLCVEAWELRDGHLPWVMTLRDAPDTVVGMCGVTRLAPHRVEVGYVLAPAYWGRGLTTEVVRAVTARAFEEPAIWRVEATCHVDNAGSARVLEKSGFTEEGRLRRWHLFPNVSDVPEDCRMFSLVRPLGESR